MPDKGKKGRFYETHKTYFCDSVVIGNDPDNVNRNGCDGIRG